MPRAYANDTLNTARITWTLVNAGATDALGDNVYRLEYAYYQGSPTASGTPTNVGFKDYTHAEVIARFGGTSSVSLAFSGSTAGYIGHQQVLSFPTTHPYTVDYRAQRADGTVPDTPVTVQPSKTGTLPAGSGDVGPLPAAPAGYELVPGQSTDVTISSAGTNTFTYYYRDLPPSITGATASMIEKGSTFDPRSGVTASDGVDGTLTGTMTVTGAVDPAVPGSYTLTYRVTDSIGNTTTVTRVVTVVDTTPPPLTVNSIPEASTTVSGTSEPGATITVTLPSGGTQTTTAGADGTWSVTSPTPLMGGQQVRVVATDASNNASPATTVTIATEYVATTITKVWSDPLTSTHPEVTLRLSRNGVEDRALTLPPGTTSVSLTDLPRYSTDPATLGTENTWSLTEDRHPDYAGTVTGSRAAGFTVTNTRILATVTLTKTDPSGDPLAGATFGLFDATGTELGRSTTDDQGRVTFTQVTSGDHYLQELVAPPGHRLATQQHTFTVTADTPTISFTVANHPIRATLPETGTWGPLVPAAGVVLLVAALVLALRGRPRSGEDADASP